MMGLSSAGCNMRRRRELIDRGAGLERPHCDARLPLKSKDVVTAAGLTRSAPRSSQRAPARLLHAPAAFERVAAHALVRDDLDGSISLARTV